MPKKYIMKFMNNYKRLHNVHILILNLTNTGISSFQKNPLYSRFFLRKHLIKVVHLAPNGVQYHLKHLASQRHYQSHSERPTHSFFGMPYLLE